MHLISDDLTCSQLSMKRWCRRILNTCLHINNHGIPSHLFCECWQQTDCLIIGTLPFHKNRKSMRSNYVMVGSGQGIRHFSQPFRDSFFSAHWMRLATLLVILSQFFSILRLGRLPSASSCKPIDFFVFFFSLQLPLRVLLVSR